MKHKLIAKKRSFMVILAVCGMTFATFFPAISARRTDASENIYKSESSVPADGSTLLPAAERVDQQLANTPVYFEENRGQQDERVKYLSRGGGTEMFLTATEAVYVVRDRKSEVESRESKPNPLRSPALDARLPTRDSKAVAVYMRLAGAKRDANFAPSEQLEHRTNYFKGNEAEWRTGIANYRRITAENIYDGINMVWKGKEQGGIQYDFVVAPEADASQIEWEIEGADHVSLDAHGGLVIETEAGVMKQSKPFTFQESEGEKSVVSSRWSVVSNSAEDGGKRFSAKYTLGQYDRSKPLTIDPLTYSTFLGGSSFDDGAKIVVDGAGNAYLTGRTFSTAFPTTPGVFDTTYSSGGDAYVAKLNAAGSALVYSTYLGGSTGDYGYGIAVDQAGNAFVTGETNSADFPTTAGAFDTTHNGVVDAFAAKLNSDGTALLYSTFVGGGGNDYGYNVAVDVAGNAFVAGSSESPTFPTTAGAFDTTHNGLVDAFVTKLNPAGSALVYSTFIGGSASDDCFGLTVDPTGSAFVTGETDSATYPTTGGAFDTTFNGIVDAYVTKLNPAGSSLVYSTFIGGNSDDGSYGVTADSTGNAYVTGYTLGGATPFPTTAGAFDTTHNGSVDAFAAKLNPAGSSLVYSTFVGGSTSDDGQAIAVDASGNAILTGVTNSPAFPTTAGTFDTTHNGDFDAFVTKLNAAGSTLVESTFIGGSSSDVGLGLAVDPSGTAFVTGETDSPAFPTTPGAFDTSQNGNEDAFVTKLVFLPAGFEGDVAPRADGDGIVLSTDVTQLRRFVTGLDTPATSPNEFQRADCAPLSSFGDAAITSGDVVQGRRYVTGLDPQNAAAGPTGPAPVPAEISEFVNDVFEYFSGRAITIGPSESKDDLTVSAPVEMELTGDEAAVSFTLVYDAERFSNPRVGLGDAVGDDAVLTVNVNEKGRITVLVDSATAWAAAKGAKSIVVVTFDVVGDEAVSFDGSIKEMSVSDVFGNPLAVRWVGRK
jgi:hypothetical protein